MDVRIEVSFYKLMMLTHGNNTTTTLSRAINTWCVKNTIVIPDIDREQEFLTPCPIKGGVKYRIRYFLRFYDDEQATVFKLKWL
jgi:hypothetical protein